MKIIGVNLTTIQKMRLDNCFKNIVPSNYVFVFDMSVVFIGFFISYLLRYNFMAHRIDLSSAFIQATVVLLVYGCFIWFGKSFYGIVRHTSFEDVIKISRVTILSLLTMLLLTGISRITGLPHINSIPLSVLLIHCMLVYSAFIVSRSLVKATFQHFFNYRSHAPRHIIIYGAGSSGILTLKALEQDKQSNYKVVGFIDDDPSKTKMFLEGLPIYQPHIALSECFVDKKNIKSLIISIQNIDTDLKKAIIEKCLELNIEVKSVPSIHSWINGNLRSEQIKKVNIEDLLERDAIKMEVAHVREELNGKVIMITGAAGSIGSGIVKQVLQFNPKKLILLDHAESALYDLQSELNGSSKLKGFSHLTELVIASIKDRYRLNQIFSKHKPEIVYHAAAYKHVPLMENNPYEALLVNVFGTKALVDVSVNHRVKKFVMISTDKAVNPTNVMGASKRIAEIYAQSIVGTDTQFITTRFGNVLGSNGSVVPLFSKQIERGGPITLTDKRITRYFMTIPEACSLVLDAGTMGKGGEIFVFDMGKPVRIYDLAKKMIQLSGYTPGLDIQIEEVGLREGEKLYEELLNNEENTLPTHHPKILRARVRKYKHHIIENHLVELASMILDGDDFNLVRKMKEIVPEFISNNSVYNVLDLKNVG